MASGEHDRRERPGAPAAAEAYADTLVVAGEPTEVSDQLATVDPRHYERLEELARGGMGAVRRAIDRRVGREVALKELLEDTPGLRRRFEREARVTGQLQHPGIVPVYEVGRWPDGRPFFAMKLVNGRPLDEVIGEALDEEARLALIPRLLPAIEAIAFAHDQGVIHRDLKPANVLLGKFGEAVVIDWGLARGFGEDDDGAGLHSEDRPPSADGIQAARSGEQLTVDGAVMGTPAYMPPEQACGDALDARADVYSLGALVYHTLTGRPPYSGEDVRAILAALLMGPPPSLGKLVPSLPRDLVGIVDKAMAEDPLDRYANAGELARDLGAFSTGRLVGAYRYSSRDLLLRFVRRNRALSASLLGLVVIAVVGSMLIFRAYKNSEAQRLRALLAEERAHHEERAALERLAQMHSNRALQLLQAHDHLGAELFAAAALFEQPQSPVSPHHGRFDPMVVATQRQAFRAGPGATWAAARALRFAARGRELPSHEDWVYDVLSGPRGRWVVTAGADRKAHVWNATLGKLHATLEGHEGTIFQTALSRNGRQLATSSYDGTIRLWSFPDGSPSRVLQHPSDRVYGVCYGSDGYLIAVGAGGVVAFFDSESGEVVSRIDAVTGVPWRLSCARDEPIALLGSKGAEALVIDVSTRTVKHRLDHANSAVRGALVTPDEQFAITVDRAGRIRRFHLQTGELVSEAATDVPCESLAMSMDGHWLALGGDAITVVDITTLRTVARLRDHTETVVALAFDEVNRHLFSGGFDHRVVEWIIPTQRQARRFMSPSESRIDAVQLSEDGAIVLASGDDGAVTWWDRKSGELLHRVDVHAGPIRALHILDGDRIVSAGVDRKLKVLDRHTGEVKRTIDLPHFGDEVSLHPDGQTLALGSGDGTVQLYDTASWAPRLTKKVHDGRTWWVGYDPSGSRLGSASFSGAIAILDSNDGEVLRRWNGHDARIYDAAWRPDARELITIDFDGWVRTWHADTGRAKAAWRVVDGGRLARVGYSNDASKLIITSHQGLRVYTPQGDLIARLDLGPTTAASWTDDGRVAVALPGEVLILPLDPTSWQGDPRQLVDAAERAAATTLSEMMGMSGPPR